MEHVRRIFRLSMLFGMKHGTFACRPKSAVFVFFLLLFTERSGEMFWSLEPRFCVTHWKRSNLTTIFFFSLLLCLRIYVFHILLYPLYTYWLLACLKWDFLFRFEYILLIEFDNNVTQFTSVFVQAAGPELCQKSVLHQYPTWLLIIIIICCQMWHTHTLSQSLYNEWDVILDIFFFRHSLCVMCVSARMPHVMQLRTFYEKSLHREFVSRTIN